MARVDSLVLSFEHREYVFSHGREPRGRGYWAFEWSGQVVWAPGQQTLTEAKRWMRDWLLKRGEFGLHVVEVCS